MKRLMIAVLLALSAGSARAQEVVAVLASDHRAYREAYESFQAAFEKPVPILPLDKAIPSETKIVLTFGAKAAIQRYPGRVTLIYAIAPGLDVDRKAHAGPTVRIQLEPKADALLGALAALQPKLKRLAVLWSSASRAASVERLEKSGAARGVAVSAERLADADELPSRLRSLIGTIDAIWLPPDPLLINAKNFEIIKHFSYSNDIPFYVPTEGLAEQGATAALSVPYAEIGRTMAGAAKAVLGGATSPAEVHSAKIHVSVNRAAAAEAALSVPAEALKTADKVLP